MTHKSINADKRPLKILDNRPADRWDHAYPVGNGRLGAMPHGLFPREQILLNEETIWAGSNPRLMPEDSAEVIEQIRELDEAGDYSGADELFERRLPAEQWQPDAYQPLGWLRLEYEGMPELNRVHRELDLETGVARTCYILADGSQVVQDVVAGSTDHQVIAVNITANQPLLLKVCMDGGRIEENDLVMEGVASGPCGTRFLARVRVQTDGDVNAGDDVLLVKNALSVTLYVSAATDLNRVSPRDRRPQGWQADAKKSLDALAGISAADVFTSAINEHARYFSRVALNLGRTADQVRELPTRERMERLRRGKTDDPELVALYVQFGRYLLIASSRPGCFPANLQGLWNPHEEPPWGSDYHLNINLQMNYWLAETMNLPEMHEPVFDFLKTLLPTGRMMAERMGMSGWCVGHATDIRGTAAILAPRVYWGGSFFGGHWLVLHVLEHYRFNRDSRFLEANWELLSEAVRFVLSWLIPGPGDGEWMARPAGSPENRFLYTDADGETHSATLSSGTSFDQFMMLQTLTDYLEAAEALGREGELVHKVRERLPHIYRPRIGEDGRLMEWRLPFGEYEPAHRHISHLLGAYPGNQINLDTEPEMRQAVYNSLQSRLAHGGAGTGWSRAWAIGVFARFGDGESAYENLLELLRTATLDNLWDECPPFQIDGNFGATAAVAEMLLQSHGSPAGSGQAYEIHLLPALPATWSDGNVKGLCARGNYSVDIRWENGRLIEATVYAGERSTGQVKVIYKDMVKRVEIKSGESVVIAP